MHNVAKRGCYLRIIPIRHVTDVSTTEKVQKKQSAIRQLPVNPQLPSSLIVLISFFISLDFLCTFVQFSNIFIIARSNLLLWIKWKGQYLLATTPTIKPVWQEYCDYHSGKKDVPSAVGSRTVRGLEEVISGRSFPHIVQCVEATARTCDLLIHRRQALPLAPGRPVEIKSEACADRICRINFLS